MPCPWYKEGYCHSPMLEKPSRDEVSANKCVFGNNYESCRLYQKPEVQQPKPKMMIKLSMFSKVNLLNQPIESQCEFYLLLEADQGYVAKCLVQDRLLTKSIAEKCAKYFISCPYRNIGLQYKKQDEESS